MKQSIRRNLEGCVWVPVLVGLLIYTRLFHWLNPTIIRLTEKGFSDTIDLPRWFLFENAMKLEVRLCASNGGGEIPKKLRGRGVVLRPGQKRKIFFPVESSFEIEVYGMDGERLEQVELRIAISRYAE